MTIEKTEMASSVKFLYFTNSNTFLLTNEEEAFGLRSKHGAVSKRFENSEKVISLLLTPINTRSLTIKC